MPTSFPSSLDDFENPNSNVITTNTSVPSDDVLFEAVAVNAGQVHVKFRPTIRISTIINENIILETNTATPAITVDPFEEIRLDYDYNSISKVLSLTWRIDTLQPNTSYRIRFANFKNVSNELFEDSFIDFETSDLIVPEEGEIPPVLPPEVQILDYTLIPDIMITSSNTTDTEDSVTFALIESDPMDFDAFVPEDYRDGVVVLKFSLIPDSDYLTSDYISAQRKLIQRGIPTRWESVSVLLAIDPIKPWIYVKFPSIDSSPVYENPDGVYFEENYKYRIKLSKEIGV